MSEETPSELHAEYDNPRGERVPLPHHSQEYDCIAEYAV